MSDIAKELARRAESLEFEGNLQASYKLLKRALRATRPRDPKEDLLLHLTDLALDLNKYEEAEVYLQQLLRHDPDNPYYLFLLGHTYARTFRLEEALTYLQRAVHQEPENPEYLRGLGHVLNLMGETRQAILTLEQALELEPENPYILAELALGFVKEGQLLRARGLVDQALKIEPDAESILFIRELIQEVMREDLEFEIIDVDAVSLRILYLIERYLDGAGLPEPWRDHAMSLWNAFAMEVHPRIRKPEVWAAALVHWVLTEYDEPRPLSRLARDFGISHSALRRAIQKFQAYVMDVDLDV